MPGYSSRVPGSQAFQKHGTRVREASARVSCPVVGRGPGRGQGLEELMELFAGLSAPAGSPASV